MTAIGPGDLLLCVDDNFIYGAREFYNVRLRAGTIYVCKEVDTYEAGIDNMCGRDHCGYTYLILVGEPADHQFCPNRFIPLKPGDDVSIEEKEKCPELI